MLYNNQTDVKDTNGETHGAGWARNYFCPNEISADQEEQTLLLEEFGGARFLPSVLRSEDGGQSDAPIADLTVCNGYNGLAAYAFTVDKDYNLDTGEDKELYVQFYRFADHKTYVPVKVAGEAEKATLHHAVRDGNKKTITPPSITEASTSVDVGQPKLVRNEGSTWLFWREDNDGLKYLNISEMLNDKVETGSGDHDTTYAVQEDGSFATDSRTGEPYSPNVQTVDFGSALTDRDLNITDYQVITDKDDNLYVIWTDVLTGDDTDNPLEETVFSPAQAIYATAKIGEQDLKDSITDDDGTINTAAPAVWSKPYRLTRDNSFNDGVTAELEDNGGLILIHNQCQLLLADTEEEVSNMIDNHQAGIWTDETTGNLCLEGLYGDLKERYGMDTDLLVEEDISGLTPGETRKVKKSITIPVSVFKFCGYDAVTVAVMDQDNTTLAVTDQSFITLDEPLNLTLNEGKDLTLMSGESAQAPTAFDSTVFMDLGGDNATKVVYSVDDPSIAAVDESGNVTGLEKGTTILTATLLPSGRSTSVKVKVQGGGSGDTVCPRDDSCPMTPFTDADKQEWYHDGIHWAIEKGIMNGTGENTFKPLKAASRAMIVTMLWRMEGSPQANSNATFKDVPEGQWYTDAVKWAAANDVVNGYDEDAFGPMDDVTREQIVTILYRYAQFKGVDVTKGEAAYLNNYTDARDVSDWAVKAFRWAVDAGVIQGMTETTLSPKTNAARAQVATMLMRYNNTVMS